MAKVSEVVIAGAARTPIGSFQGALAALPAARLGAVAIREAILRARISPSAVDEVVMGNVVQAGQGQAPARQAALYAGLPNSVPCTTLNKMCGSGLKAVIAGAQAILAGDAELVVAGGMESMSNIPYYAPKMRTGARMGNAELVDGMLQDGLLDAYEHVHMGTCAEETAARFGFTRQAQDEYAQTSTRRAIVAQTEGLFRAEIAPVEVEGKKGERTLVADDEGPKLARPEKIPALKPAFKKDGTVTAGNSSSISDGAAAVVLASGERARRDGLPVLARLSCWGGTARAPLEFTIAPADAVQAVLGKAGLGVKDIDLWELSEAFAVVALANVQLLGLDREKVNVRGGAVVLGHPVGASGTRLLVTLLYALADAGKKRGLAALCIGGGEAVAAIVERP